MSSGADLFVVCKQCGSEVSPYITECPYCGHRLRRRAPKLPRERETSAKSRGPRAPRPALGRLRRGEISGIRADAPPYATAALVASACAVWIATRTGYLNLGDLVIIGPLHGEWWRLLTSQFAYGHSFAGAVSLFVALLGVGIFGSLLERRHGPLVVLALFLGAGVSAGLLAQAVYAEPLLSGCSAGALALLAAWAIPDLQAARAGEYYDGDLLGTGAIAATLLAVPFAYPPASWLAGVTGGVFGLTLGLGLSRVQAA
jgi:hypothetical protein